MNQVVFSHKTDHWATPKAIYNEYMKKGYVDPCPLNCEVDNLKNEYKEQKLFINPPYSNISGWVDSIIHWCNDNNCYVHLLIPARTDTKYFHKLLNNCNCSVYFIKGRLHFNDQGAAPFPTVIISVKPNNVIGSKVFIGTLLEPEEISDYIK